MNSLAGLPALSVELDGDALAARDFGTLEAVRVEQRLSLPTLCELVFANPESAFTESALAAHGRSLRVSIPGAAVPLFSGEVTAVEQFYEAGHGSSLRLRGYDPLHRLRKRQPVRVHVQTTVAELAAELIGDLGLTVRAEADGPLLRRIIQHRQSDLDLLLEALEPCGLYATLRGTVLCIVSLEGSGEAIPLALGRQLIEARLVVNVDSACRGVEVSAWDTSRVELHRVRADTPRSGRTSFAGAEPTLFDTSGERRITAEFAEDDRQAEAFAQADLDRRAAREVTLRATADGDPSLMPGAIVKIDGVAPSLAGSYVLTAVTHRVERSTGFISELTTEPPQPRPRSRAASLALGIVTGVDDPESLGRVRVSLPAHGNLETDWMSVVSQGAGHGKGFALLPDTGDQVLVLFAGDRNTHGFVLGGLYGSANPIDSVVNGGAVARYSLRTPGGRKLAFDDGARSIRMEDAGGNYIEFSPERLMFHSAVPLYIEAIGKPVVIRGSAINFEES